MRLVSLPMIGVKEPVQVNPDLVIAVQPADTGCFVMCVRGGYSIALSAQEASKRLMGTVVDRQSTLPRSMDC